jgi:hypothetical protein
MMLIQTVPTSVTATSPYSASKRSGGLVFLGEDAYATNLEAAIHKGLQTPQSYLYGTAQNALNNLMRVRKLESEQLTPQLSQLLKQKPLRIETDRIALSIGENKDVPLQLIALKHAEAPEDLTAESRYLYKKIFQQVEAQLSAYLSNKQMVSFANKSVRGKESLMQRLYYVGAKSNLEEKWQKVRPQYPSPESLQVLATKPAIVNRKGKV